MPNKRKMVQINLLKNSIAAYFAAIEIHNKPNILYRYETVTLLIINAWELLLKSYIRKFIKTRSIFETNGHTIPFNKAIVYVDEYINTIQPKSFIAIRENLFKIEEYRNNIAHFYNEELTPHIFMLVARATLNYVEFMKRYFSKDIISDEGLFIMPLGFKLPFAPADFLTKKAIKSNASRESRKFIENIIKVIQDLRENDVEESIVLGFNIYLESVKKESNSDLLVAITNKDEADVSFTKTTAVKISDDPNAQLVRYTDAQFRDLYPYNHAELLEWCKRNTKNYTKNKYEAIKKDIKKHIEFASIRHLDSKNPKSSSQFFYSEKALKEMKRRFELV